MKFSRIVSDTDQVRRACEGAIDVELLGHSQAQRTSHFACLDDFHPWQGLKSVDIRELLLVRERAERLTPYCISAKSCCVVLVELPSAASYADQGALFFETQRRRAGRVYCVSFARAVQLAQELAPRVDFGKLLMLFNTGRCGSNLLSAALSQFQGVCSPSEPDLFAPLYIPVPEHADVGARAAPQLVWAASVFLLHWAQRATPGFRLLAVKARSRLAGDIAAVLRALPGARSAMMYRSFLPTLGSMAVAFRPYISRHPWLGLACALGLDPLLYAAQWLLGGPRWRELADTQVLRDAEPAVPAHVVWRCGHLAVHAIKVVNTTDQARRAHAAGFLSFCVTYEALVRHRAAYVRQILAAACAPPRSQEQVQSPGGKSGNEAAVDFPLRPGASPEEVFGGDQHCGRLSSCSGGQAMWRLVSRGGVGRHGLSRRQVAHLMELRRWLQPGLAVAEEEVLPGTLPPP